MSCPSWNFNFDDIHKIISHNGQKHPHKASSNIGFLLQNITFATLSTAFTQNFNSLGYGICFLRESQTISPVISNWQPYFNWDENFWEEDVYKWWRGHRCPTPNRLCMTRLPVWWAKHLNICPFTQIFLKILSNCDVHNFSNIFLVIADAPVKWLFMNERNNITMYPLTTFLLSKSSILWLNLSKLLS